MSVSPWKGNIVDRSSQTSPDFQSWLDIFIAKFNTLSDEHDSDVSTISAFVLANIEISASVASNDLTVALKTKDSGDPSSADPVDIAFRSNTLTSGGYQIVEFASAKSVVVPAGGTLGFASSESNYIYVVAAYDGTTKAIGVTCLPPDEGVLHSTTAVGTGSDATNVIYTSSALTNAAVRLIGCIKITHGASVWDSAPTEQAVWSPNMPRELVKEFELGGNFTAGEKVRMVVTKTRGGAKCDIFSTVVLTHSSGSAPASGTIIPSEYRPSSNDAINCLAVYSDSFTIQVTTAGALAMNYRDTATGAGSSRTNTNQRVFISWYIED